MSGNPDSEEVKCAFSKLNGDSASVPNGLAGTFYQVCWDIIRSNIV